MTSTGTGTIVDLTLTLRDGMRGVEIRPKTSIGVEGYTTTDVLLYTHAGTHLDAPLHFVPNAGTVDKLDLNKCVGPALVVDVSYKPANSLITVEDLAPYAARIGRGSRVLLRTDWGDHADAVDYRTHFPRVSTELAEWLVERSIRLLGVEAPSVASLQDRDELHRVHHILLEAEVVIVESLTNLRQLDEEEVFFIALPLKFAERDGSPVRAVAIDGVPQTWPATSSHS